ncbi:MAG: hypothetical protein AAGD22_16940 [Verrucomicrobiota bacterium]
MKVLITICFAFVSATIGSTTSFAGGAGVEFKRHGIPLLNQSPPLAGVLDKHFAVENQGLLGPSDAPFDRAKLYTYMDFRARSKKGKRQVFLIRLHFDRGEDPVLYTRVPFQRIEIFPVPTSAEAELRTLRDLHEATGANKAEISSRITPRSTQQIDAGKPDPAAS